MKARWFAGLLLPVGPAAVAILRFVLPYDTADDSETMVVKIAAEPDRQSLVLWLIFVAALTLVPAVYLVGGVTREGAPRLTTAAMVLLVPGYLGLSLMYSQDALTWVGVQEGLDPATVARLFDGAHPSADVGASIFVAGHLIGTVLLGIALWRSAAVPRWAAAAVAVSQPIHLTAVLLSNHPLDLVGWGLQAVGFAAVSAVLLRQASVRPMATL
jgi:hypothetical protein